MSHAVATLTDVKPARLLQRIIRDGVGPVDFEDLVKLVIAFGFQEVGGRGSHRVFARPDVRELVNLQEDKDQVKPYQVRQVVAVVRRYDLHLEEAR
jgi:predicted RNA binding protein YcfA (HicA-like mRNA interferase family)